MNNNIIFYVIVGIIFFIFFIIKCINNYNYNYNYTTEFIIIKGSFRESIINSRTFDNLIDLNLKPSFMFFTNFIKNELIAYGGFYNNSLTFPTNNIINGSLNWLYPGWFAVVNGRGDYICANSNNKNIRRLNYDKNILKYLTSNSSDINDHIIITNILYNFNEIVLISINKIASTNDDAEYYNILGNIILYIKNNFINDKLFIMCGETGLNGKYIQSIINNIFKKNTTISSCYDGIFNYVSDNIYSQTSFILIDKRLCPYGIKFGLRYVENEISLNNLIIYATVFNSNNRTKKVEYYNDDISINIINSIKSQINYNDKFVNWENIDISNLNNNFTNDSINMVDDPTSYTREKLDTILNNINYNIKLLNDKIDSISEQLLNSNNFQQA
ncbi:ORF MSV214 SCG gene family protein [Melanoplus sanguinipes entomopoxvirus]|uniref:ORF MSV214 SCG gene family protein n=1 Tax=Melanoplus sanguinipes entomopoxvirus TaxID=83191 RepID=Q9YVM8_MSEPV|nr:ORF MSV214 SCG gene family protein [Melanoplus sanguinipes entomopoxvirus]AAC97751.1 ORF MSV214 SCG gene family protein [Melanoplus sanguinipes entomopoxvirus 'O']